MIHLLSLSLSLSLSSFHALRDECYIRHSLQRQSAALHHATVGYAVNARSKVAAKPNQMALKPLVSATQDVVEQCGVAVNASKMY